MAKCSVCGKEIGYSYFMADGKKLCDECNKVYEFQKREEDERRRKMAMSESPVIEEKSKTAEIAILLIIVGVILIIAGVLGIILISQSEYGVSFTEWALDIGAGLGAASFMSGEERIMFFLMRNRTTLFVTGVVCSLIGFLFRHFDKK